MRISCARADLNRSYTRRTGLLQRNAVRNAVIDEADPACAGGNDLLYTVPAAFAAWPEMRSGAAP